MADYKYNLDIDVRSKGIKETRQQLEELKQNLADAKSQGKSGTFLKTELEGSFKSAKAATKAIEEVEKALDKLESKGNNLTIRDLGEFNNDLRKAGVSVTNLDKYLEKMGKQGVKSLGQVSQATYDLGVQVDKVEDKFSKLGDQIQHEIVDNVVSAGFNAMGDAINSAIYFSKDLNRTLTDIQVVSGKSAEDMAEFAKQSNAAAKELGSSTDEFANSALIFYQQGGYTEQEVRKLAEATTVAANITRQSTDVVADQLTALINSFGVETENVMTDIVDVFAKIGAVSGSNFEELATATQKFASQARTAGYEGAEGIQEMGAQIATVVETTRQSADSIGVGFKTILSRIQGVKDSDGVMDSKLTKSLMYLNEELEALGAKQFEVFDEFGDLRGANELITDLGETWHKYGDQLSEATKQYVMQEVAGVEQASRLASLIGNWDSYLEILSEAQNSQGVALQQQLIYLDSIDAKSARLRTEFESIVMTLNVEGLLKTFYDGMTNIAEAVGDVTSNTAEMGGKIAEALGFSRELGETMGAWTPIVGVLSAGFNKFAAATIAARIANSAAKKSYVADMQEEIKTTNSLVEKTTKSTQRDIARTSGVEKAKEYAKLQQEINQAAEKEAEIAAEIVRVVKESVAQGTLRSSKVKELVKQEELYKEKLRLIKVATEDILEGNRELEDIVKILPKKMQEQIEKQKILTDETTTRAEKEALITNELKKQAAATEGLILATDKEIVQEGKSALGSKGDELEKQAKAAEKDRVEAQKKAEALEKQNKALSKTRATIGVITTLTLGLPQIAAGFSEVFEEGSNKAEGFGKILTGLGTSAVSMVEPLQEMFPKIALEIGKFLPQIGLAMVAIGAVITLIGGIKSELEKVAEANAEITQTFTEQKSRIDELKKSVDSVEESYLSLAETGASAQEILASGDEQLIEQYLEYANTVANVAPELIQGYDDQGRAIINLADSYDVLTNSVKEQEQANYAMMSANSAGFATELASNYQMAQKEINGAVAKQKELQEALKDAMDAGDTGKIKTLNADLLGVNTTIAEQKQILSDTSALVNANLVQPFFKGNEAITKWADTFKGRTLETKDGLVNLSASINGIALDTQRLYELIQAGDAEGVNNLFLSAERNVDAFGNAIIAAGDNADAMLEKFFSMDEYLQDVAMSLQGAFGDNINVLEGFDGNIDDILKGTENLADSFGVNAEAIAEMKVDELTDDIESLKDEYEALERISKSQVGLTVEQAERYGDLRGMIDEASAELERYVDAIEQGNEAQLVSAESMGEFLEVLEDTPEGYNKIIDAMNGMLDEQGRVLDEYADNYIQMYSELIDGDTNWYNTQILNNQDVTRWLQDELGIRATDFSNYEQLKTEAERLGVGDRLNLMTHEQQEAARLKIESDNAQRTSDATAKLEMLNSTLAYGEGTQNIYRELRNSGYNMFETIAIMGANMCDNLFNNIANFGTAVKNVFLSIANFFIENVSHRIADFWNGLPDAVTNLFGGYKMEKVALHKITAGDSKSTYFADKVLGNIENKKNEKDIASMINPIKLPNLTSQTVPSSKPLPSTNKKPPNVGDKDSGSGSNKKPSSGSGSGSDKNSGSDKDVADTPLELDPLYEYTRALELLENQLSLLKAKEKDLFGKDLIANLQQQNKLLATKVETLKSEAAVIDKQLASQKGGLSSKGFTFDANGMITNYNEMIEKLTKQANSKTGEAKEKAIADLKDLKDNVKEYDKLLTDTSAKLREDIIKTQQEIQENYQQQLEVVINVELDLSDAYKKMYDFQQKFNDGFDKTSESLANMEEYAESLMKDLKTMEGAISKIANDSNLTQKQKNEMLEKLIDEYMDAAENLDDVIKEMGEKISESLEQGLELIEETAEGYERIKDYAEEYADLLKDIYGPTAKDDIMKLYDIQIKSTEGMIDALKEQQSLAKSYVDALKPGTEEWKAAKAELDKINAEIGSTTLGLLDLMREKMEDFFELSSNALENEIFGGSLDEFESTWDKINDQQDKYLSTSEKAAKIGKLQVQIQQEIAKTDDPKKKAQLQKFIDNELKALKEKDKLTEKDLERAEKVYALTLKQQALDNQEMTAMMARLVRDEAGNWSYEYVQDVEAVKDAQNDLADALEDLMNTDKNNLKDNQKEMLELQKQYFEELRKLQEKAMAGGFASPEEFNAALDALNSDFLSQLAQLKKEQESLLGSMSESSLAYLLHLFEQSGGGLGIFGEATEEIMAGIIEALKDGSLEWSDVITGNYEKIAEALGVTKEDAEEAMKELNDSIKEDFTESNGVVSDSIEDMKDKIEQATDDMKQEFEEYFDKVEEGMEEHKDAIDDLEGYLKDQQDAINKVTDAIKSETDAILKNLIPAYDKLKQKYDSEVQPSVDKYVGTLKDMITQLKNNTTSITGSKGLNEALDKLKAEMEKTKREAQALAGSQGLKGVENAAVAAYGKITSVTSPSVAKNISSVGSSLDGVTSKANTALKAVNAIPRSVSVKVDVPTTTFKVAAVMPANPLDPNTQFKIYSTSGKYIIQPNKAPYRKYYIGDTVSFDTGGYTGDWSKSGGMDGKGGKMAMLHQKELVLNAVDTENLLNAVKINKDMLSQISQQPIPNVATTNNSTTSTQETSINIEKIELPNVSDVDSFINELKDLPNRAIQYKYSKKTY